ncbi:MAG TPA: glycogen/starch/alpha-glucan phosphorylase [Alphaproteobacteria bacterium]|nr:glycogen/starch/alpha-glucan phosphorylase [Alphaproteobacteria bacterium]
MDKVTDAGTQRKQLRFHDFGDVPFLGQPDALFERHLLSDAIIELDAAYNRQHFEAVARSVRDILARRWIATRRHYDRENPKRVFYMSMEFLIGRSLSNNITNLMLHPEIEDAMRDGGFDWLTLAEREPDAGLGNGGLGRLAACFLDSMATMALPATGYGLRYEYGMFRQSIEDGWQREHPDNWLRRPDPWEVSRRGQAVNVRFGCTFEIRQGNLRIVPGRPSILIGIPYDRPIVGFGGKTVNSLRLWSATAPDAFNFQEFSTGDFVGAMVGNLAAHTLTRVLYPDDSTDRGQELRFAQEYFLVACSLGDLVRHFRRHNDDWTLLPDKVAIQLNDTHPSFSVAELMRILLDEAGLDWETAWDLTRRTLAYTNHTLLPEALEKWPLHYFQLMVPRQLEIIYEINRRFLDDVRRRFPDDEGKVQRVSLIEEGAEDKVRMANLAIVGSHSTNGVTPRRWLLMANPELSSAIAGAIGDGWTTDFAQIAKLKPFAEDAAFRKTFLQAKRDAKVKFANWLNVTSGQTVDPDSIFDCQVKRIHEYKRQMLNALRVIVLYDRLRANPALEMAPRTFFFAGKAAPAYRLAKLIIKFLNNLAGTIDGDPAVRGRIKVVFLPEYCVSLAERLIPAADVSNQISTAGFEASGTSNMKFMMNGALTLGTRDGATIEMAEEAGEENFFLFGLTAQQVADSAGWYNPYWHYDHDPETRAALDLIGSDYFSRNEPSTFGMLLDSLLKNGDRFMHLADLTAYLEADQALSALYATPEAWARKAILNVAGSGKFSSDRTIGQYASEIWNAKPCPVPCGVAEGRARTGQSA